MFFDHESGLHAQTHTGRFAHSSPEQRDDQRNTADVAAASDASAQFQCQCQAFSNKLCALTVVDSKGASQHEPQIIKEGLQKLLQQCPSIQGMMRKMSMLSCCLSVFQELVIAVITEAKADRKSSTGSLHPHELSCTMKSAVMQTNRT